VEGYRQAAGRTWTLTLAALVTGAVVTAGVAMSPTVAGAGDGSVRVLSAGPVQLAPGAFFEVVVEATGSPSTSCRSSSRRSEASRSAETLT